MTSLLTAFPETTEVRQSQSFDAALTHPAADGRRSLRDICTFPISAVETIMTISQDRVRFPIQPLQRIENVTASIWPNQYTKTPTQGERETRLGQRTKQGRLPTDKTNDHWGKLEPNSPSTHSAHKHGTKSSENLPGSDSGNDISWW
ncbi:hypothetical protein TcWFU_002897 [Taenia crassiceps]|uniref:Uncharacterized protein n=1 Tax=Taenia crassiceps TaxID=6207 RepID=A0ABR4Q345_9CEST